MKLQLALDFISIDDALSVAAKAADHVDFIEAGTPLIKSEGLRAVTALKERFPDKVIVADMKTMDTGFLEADIALKAGADAVSVLGAADRETIRGAAEAARKHGKMLMVDSIGMDDLGSLARKIEGIGAEFVVLHTGIDQQHCGKCSMSMFERMKGVRFSAKVALCGGLDEESVRKLPKEPRIDLVIIGGAITKAKDPAKAASAIRRALDASG